MRVWGKFLTRRLNLITCYRLKFICEKSLTPNVRGFGGRAYGKRLDHEGGVLMNRINVHIREPPKVPSPLPPWEGRVRRWPSMNQRVGPHQMPNLLMP